MTNNTELARLIESLEKLPSSSIKDEGSEAYSEVEKRSQNILRIEAQSGKLAMRKRWSTASIVWITGIICFDIILVCLLGLGIWKFDDPSIVIAVISDSFLKIVGLGIFIVKAIFRD